MRFLTLLTLIAGLAGCFALSDTGRFEEDLGCDMELRLRAFSPHTDDFFSVAVVRPNPGEEQGGDLEVLAVFNPLEDSTVNLRLPAAVPAAEDPRRAPFRIDFFGDFDGSGGLTEGDHRWSFQDACTQGPQVFDHNLDFDPLQNPASTKADVRVHLCGAMLDGPLEVRVVGRSLPGRTAEETRAVGLYRFSRREVTRNIGLPGVVGDIGDHRIDMYIDSDADGEFDDGETSWSFDWRPGADPSQRECAALYVGAIMDPQVLCQLRDSVPAGAILACEDVDGRINVTLGSAGDRNQVPIQNYFEDGSPNSWINFDPADTGE